MAVNFREHKIVYAIELDAVQIGGGVGKATIQKSQHPEWGDLCITPAGSGSNFFVCQYDLKLAVDNLNLLR